MDTNISMLQTGDMSLENRWKSAILTFKKYFCNNGV